jgi:hypothetical protein
VGTSIAVFLLVVGSEGRAQPPSAVRAPDLFRESLSAQNLQALGLDPQHIEINLELTPGLAFSQQTTLAEEAGVLSAERAERTKAELTYGFSPSGSAKLFWDVASVDSPYGGQRSSVLRASLDQGFGKGLWAGKMSLAHEDTSNYSTFEGHSGSRLDSVSLNWGLGKSASMFAGASVGETVNSTHTRTAKQDFVLTSMGTAVAEYHHADTSVGEASVETSQLALRTPTLNLADMGTFAASTVRNESSATGEERIDTFNLALSPIPQAQLTANCVLTDRPAGSETVTSVNLSAKPNEKVDLTASLFDASRPTGDESLHTVSVVARPGNNLTLAVTQTDAVKPGVPDTSTTVVTSNLKVSDEVAVSANVTSTSVEGTGTTTVTSVDAASVPTDGTGLAIKASVVDTKAPAAEIDPTIHVQVDYTTKAAVAFSGSYHQAPGVVAPEVVSTLTIPLCQGTLSASFAQRTATPNVIPTQAVGAQYVRPVAWGLTGNVGFDSLANLVGPRLATWGVKAGLSGENELLGKVDLQCTTGTIRNALGSTSASTTASLSIARAVGDLGTCSLSVKHTETEYLPDDDQIRLDATLSF